MTVVTCLRSQVCFRGSTSLLLLLIFASSSFAQTVLYNGRPAIADEVLIQLKTNDAAAIARTRNAVTAAVFQNLSPSLAIHRVRVPGLNFAVWMDVLSRLPDVLQVEPNYIIQAINTVPNDPNYSLLWGMSQISAPSAWDTTTGGTSVVLGVVDTGIDYTHPDLAANVWSAPSAFTVDVGGPITCPAGSHGFNAITRTCDPFDDHSHGTHTSGTVGAVGNNNFGVSGVNWTGRVMALKFISASGVGNTADAIIAIEFALQVKAAFAGTSTPVNVRILSNSWGGTGFSASLLAEINKANANDVLFVAAAGNTATNNDSIPTYPASYSAPNIVAVAATDSTDTLANFSNYGATSVHLAAPGVDIYSTVPGGDYATASGTSMATPHVAGAALLTLSACPSLNTAALKNALLNNVDLVDGLNGKTITRGRLNVNKTILSCKPTSIAATSGTPQSTTVGTAFSSALQAKVTDASSNPISGVLVTFTTPSSGASATFGSGNTVTTTTNASGIATSPIPTANGNAGNYSVTASVPGLTPATFSLSNIPSGGGSNTTIFGNTVPSATFNPGSSPVALGMKFRSDVNGMVTGVRFYKGSGDTGIHTGTLWSSTGTALATVNFSGETASGWQQMNFSSAVPITANTTYIVSYTTTGFFYYSLLYFQSTGVDTSPLHALRDGADGGNGLYNYGSGVPNQTYLSSNYWVDVLFAASGSSPSPQTIVAISGTPQSTTVGTAFNSTLQAKVMDASSNPISGVVVTFTAPSIGASATFGSGNSVTATTNASGIATSPTPTANGISGNYSVTASVPGLTSATFSLNNTPSGGGSNTTIFGNSVPSAIFNPGSSPVSLGLKFRSDVSGMVTGVRFYKGSGDTGIHIGTLWSSTGTVLATVTFSGETASGWQQMNFSSAVPITANTSYIVSYSTTGAFYYSLYYFQNTGVDSAPLHALRDGDDGPNGLYNYGSGIPNQTYQSSNYWVDVLFVP